MTRQIIPLNNLLSSRSPQSGKKRRLHRLLNQGPNLGNPCLRPVCRQAGALKISAIVVCFLVSFLCKGSVVFGELTEISKEVFVGEFSGWGVKIPISNYYFVKAAISIFGTRWGGTPQTEQELEDATWEQLVLSYEAFRRDIKVEQKEIDEEIAKMLQSEKVSFDWQKDKDSYEKWVRDKTREPTMVFENQLRHLIQLENLRKQVLENFRPTVTEEEAKEEFINEYNTIELELKQFDQQKDAQDFYEKIKDPRLWEEQAKDDPKFFMRPGFVSFEFLINMWKLPKDDLYKMLELKIDTIYPPIPIYKGYGVCRILKKRPAVEADFPKLRESYFKQVESIKKYEELKIWVKQLKVEAGIIVYPKQEAKEKNKK